MEWIAEFRALAKRCPKNLWLYSASSSLHIMKTPDDDNEMNEYGGVNYENSIDTIKIRNDGGNW